MKDWMSGVAILLGTAFLGVIAYDLVAYANIPHLSALLSTTAGLGSALLSVVFGVIIVMLPAVIGKGLRLWGEYK